MIDRIRRAIAPPPPPEPSNGGGLPFSALYPSSPGPVGIRPIVPTQLRTCTGSGASQLIAPANAARTELTIYNGAGVPVVIAYGAIASSSSATLTLDAGGTLIIEQPDPYQGDVSAVWASGSIDVTERARG